MQLQKAKKSRAKIKMALQGSSGSGKSLGALLVSKGLTNNNLSKVAVVCSENGSANLYDSLGPYNVVTLQPPYTPEKFISAIDLCLKESMEVIILDSISVVWEELLNYHSKLAGNSFTNWNKVSPRQNLFINKILQADAHIIATMRTKQDYVLNQKDGKYIPEKVGLKAIQRNDVDYEFTLVFDIDNKHNSHASKDRTGIFSNAGYFKITENTGAQILAWCNSDTLNIDEVKNKIHRALSLSELTKLYNDNPKHQKALNAEFVAKKQQLEQLINLKNFSQNGNHTSN